MQEKQRDPSELPRGIIQLQLCHQSCPFSSEQKQNHLTQWSLAGIRPKGSGERSLSYITWSVTGRSHMENSSVEVHLLEYFTEVILHLRNYSLLCFSYFYYNYLTSSATSYLSNLPQKSHSCWWYWLCHNNRTQNYSEVFHSSQLVFLLLLF